MLLVLITEKHLLAYLQPLNLIKIPFLVFSRWIWKVATGKELRFKRGCNESRSAAKKGNKILLHKIFTYNLKFSSQKNSQTCFHLKQMRNHHWPNMEDKWMYKTGEKKWSFLWTDIIEHIDVSVVSRSCLVFFWFEIFEELSSCSFIRAARFGGGLT